MREAFNTRMAQVNMPMDQEILSSKGEKTSLKKLSEGKKAVLLDFWATRCGPCMATMPQRIQRATFLNPQGIHVVGINTENVMLPTTSSITTKDKMSLAERVKKLKKVNYTWLVEPDGDPFAELLEIDSLPRVTLMTPEGKILFNGSSRDPKFQEELKKLGVSFDKPAEPEKQ